MWKTVDVSELTGTKTTTYSFTPHAVIKRKRMQHVMCKYCGLVYLKNPWTRWAIKVGCNHNYHPQNKVWRKRVKL